MIHNIVDHAIQNSHIGNDFMIYRFINTALENTSIIMSPSLTRGIKIKKNTKTKKKQNINSCYPVLHVQTWHTTNNFVF